MNHITVRGTRVACRDAVSDLRRTFGDRVGSVSPYFKDGKDTVVAVEILDESGFFSGVGE